MNQRDKKQKRKLPNEENATHARKRMREERSVRVLEKAFEGL